MAYTQLIPSATPGPRYSFLAKTGAGAHTGLFTALSVSALPGARRSFTAKSAAVVPHAGLFTTLSLSALPGMRKTFAAKDRAVVPSAPRVIPEEAGLAGMAAGPELKTRRREEWVWKFVIADFEMRLQHE